MPPEVDIRELLTPPGRPGWVNEGNALAGLRYLGWGHRDYFVHPVPATCAGGWLLLVVQVGHVHVGIGELETTAGPGTVLLIPPDKPVRLRHNEEDTECSLLTGIWQDAPTRNALRGGTSGQVNANGLLALERLHAQCRRDAEHPDGESEDVLRFLRSLIDTELLRASGKNRAAALEPAALLRILDEYILSHPAVRPTVLDLATHCGIPQVALVRIIREQRDVSPGRYINNVRMREALRLTREEGWKVKDAACHFGFKHANDLSRALKTFVRREQSVPESTSTALETDYT